nr:unnamed protein product [Spirometra erinaceieuropaei]
MVGPPVSARDRLRHQHVPLISLPDDDIVQQVPLARPRMPPGGLLSFRQTEEGVCQDEVVFCAGAEKQQSVVVGAAETVGTQHSSPGSMVCADTGVEVAKDNQLVRLRHSRQEGVQVLVEFVSDGVGAGHRRSVGADDGGKLASSTGGRRRLIRRSFIPCGKQDSRPTMSVRMAKAMPASRRSALGRPLQKKV